MKRFLVIMLAFLLLLTAACVSVEHYVENEQVDPTVPDEPEEPAEPEQPTEPETPTEPEQPVVPDEPEQPQAQGDLVFDTVTLSGDPISSDMIRDYDLIMVNFWAEWCGPCVGEMPEIERIHEAYPNVLILGVWIGDELNGAKEVIADSGVTYPTLGVSGTLEKYSGMSMYIPATYFFDRSGNEIGEPVIGSQDYEGWKATVEGLLP